MCSLLCVCTLDGLMQSTYPEYGSSYLAVCHVTFTFVYIYIYIYSAVNRFVVLKC